MAYVNVKDWSVDQVMYWLKGLDNVIFQYEPSFLNNQVTGQHLLNLRADDLDNIGVNKLGHQEIILEAVEHLRNFHYELDKENLQMHALKLSCAANSLYKELLMVDERSDTVKTQVMSDVHNIVAAIKPLALWLDRSPFTGDKDYLDNKKELLQLSLEMAYVAHRGKFSENPVLDIKKNCEKLAKIADYIIQDICDPMILQPASLDLATLKKKEQDIGFIIMPSYYPVHQIVDIKFGSPAHGSTKIEEGDEIVQVNYQTVVGWQAKKVMHLLIEASPEIVLTLKKRPRHSKVYGQIYMKPYRLPSRKKPTENWSRWNDNLPSPRLLPIIDLPITITKSEEEINNEEGDLTSSDSEAPDSPLEGSFRMYPVKPRSIPQRRNTITGTTPTNKRPTTSIEQYWDFLQSCANGNQSSSFINIDKAKVEEEARFLRDKSVSYNVGLDSSPRPTTVIGISHSHRKKSVKGRDKATDQDIARKVNFDDVSEEMKTRNDAAAKIDNKLDLLDIKVQETNLNEEKSVSINSLSSLHNENISFIDEGRELTDRSSMVSDLVKESSLTDSFLKSQENDGTKGQNMPVKDPSLAEINVHNMIKKFDDKRSPSSPKPRVLPRGQGKKPPEVPQKPDNKKPLVPPRSATTKLRGRLDKSHSTPAYDLTEEDPTQDSPPIKIEKLPDVIPKIPESIIETSPVDDKNCFFPPEENQNTIIEINEVPEVIKKLENIPDEVIEQTSEAKPEIRPAACDLDLPPKPPPRKSLDNLKPAYPADSPKPIVNIPEPPKTIQPASKKCLEFPETNVDLKKMGSMQSIRSTESNDYLVPIQVKQPFEMPGKSFKSSPKAGFEVDGASVSKNISSHEVHRPHELKVSPTNSIVKAMISNKGKSKKKNNLIAKKRKVTVNDLTPADNQGYLYQRLRGKHNPNVHWEKRWFVLLGSCLYGFKNKDDPRASCLIFLSDFTVSVANEVKSRSNAFKVYHTGTVFYFSAEDSDSLQIWIDLINAACLHNESLKNHDGRLYSETDDSDTEKPKNAQPEKTDSLKKFGSLKKFSLKKASTETPHTGSTSLDRKWFFNKTSSNAKNNLPVPTSQFRSYRKVKNEPTQASVRTGNFTSHVPILGPSNLHQAQNISVPNLAIDISRVPSVKDTSKSKQKNQNFVHASNPSLCSATEFTTPPATSKHGTKDRPENLAGLPTLEELMNRQSEESRTNPHHQFDLSTVQSDVVYGELPIRSPEPSSDAQDVFDNLPLSRSASQSEKHESSSCFGKRLGSLKRNQNKGEEGKMATYPKAIKGLESKSNRSLPRALKIQTGSRECEEYTVSNLHYSSDKNLSRNESSEMICCSEIVNESQFAQNRMLDDSMVQGTPKKSGKIKRQTSFGSTEKKSSRSLPGFTNRVGDSSRAKLKPTTQYTPMPLPLLTSESKSTPKFAVELNLDEKHSKSGGKLSKIFSGKSEKKDKTFLGSPKLHRAIFGKHHNGGESSWTPSSSQSICLSQSSMSLDRSTSIPPPQLATPIRPHADYPGLKYPPVFEAETYSLADPQSSLNLLRSKQKKDNMDGDDSSIA
ncbi:connector enhancer of ksr isoform X2 [Rhynchophorus ferrugineus]|uniref:connector enhancer of ksr isoform X2 n=1 Tax=Rhynchophorus ferrugineus TaxID=354439 RepID=UPI003FCE47DA